MNAAVIPGGSPPPTAVSVASAERVSALSWIRDGRLVLVDANREMVSPDKWTELPGEVRARAEEDFDRVVRSNTRAAVLYLR